jgi:hypothetical protein
MRIIKFITHVKGRYVNDEEYKNKNKAEFKIFKRAHACLAPFCLVKIDDAVSLFMMKASLLLGNRSKNKVCFLGMLDFFESVQTHQLV